MRVVAVFGGGGAKSIACAGAWRAIHEVSAQHGAPLQVVHLVGTSMGAIVAAAFAAGATYDEVVIAAGSLSQRDVAPIDPLALVKGVFTSHLLKPAGPRRVIERLVPATRWEELKIPLIVTATDLDSGELVLLGPQQGVRLHDALYASCALPLYFPPARIDGRRLVDGGLRAVLGLAAAARIPADLVVAVHVGPGFDELPPPPSTASPRLPPPLIRAHGEAIRIMMAAQVEQAIREWPQQAARLVVVRPVAEREATFAVDGGARYVRAGYEATKQELAFLTCSPSH